MWSRIAKRLGMNIDYDDPRIWAGIQKQWGEVDELTDKLGKNYMDFSREELNVLSSVILEFMGIKSEGTSEVVLGEFRENFFKVFRLYPRCIETLKQIKA
jgi:hypothetical protein